MHGQSQLRDGPVNAATIPTGYGLPFFNRALALVLQPLYLEAKTFLHGLLVVEDKLSMAHSIENRVPFLDNDLVDFAQRVPVRHKLRDLSQVVRLNENDPGPKTARYFEKTRDGKVLLRRVMSRYVPETIADHVIERFGRLPKIMRASISDLVGVEGVGEARARAIKDGLARVAESSILDRYS